MFGARGRTFRGEIYDFVATAPMGKGHGNAGKPFDIASANYLREPFQAIRASGTRKVVIKAGVKTMKTFLIECAMAYYCAHGDGDIGFYLADEASAKDHARSRFWDWFWNIEELARMRQTVTNRHDETITEVYFPGKTFRVWPLNEGATQNINLFMVALTDAFLAGSTGLIEQMIARTTQYKNIRKILIESQGGVDDDDFDLQWKDTDQRLLQVDCPHCGGSQPFEWCRERPDEFIARPPKTIASLDQADWVAHHTPLLRGRMAGMKRGDEALVKLANGEYNESEVLRLTHYECYHCGSAWRDDGEFGPVRMGLDASSHYLPSRLNALPGNVGFSWPQWINRRLRWGDIMLDYLKAERLKQTHGNLEKLKQWYQKVAGKTWNPNLARSLRVQAQAKYDLKSDWAEEWRSRRCLVIDCQQDLQYFWASVWAVSKTGKSRQLWRGILRGFGEEAKEAKDQPETIVGKQKEFGILHQNVFMDGNYMRKDLVEECTKHGHWRMRDGERDWFCWTLLIGSPNKDFAHKEDRDAKSRHPVSDVFYEQPTTLVDKYRVSVEVYYFSALQMGDMFARYRDGHGPETLFLPEAEPLENKLSWTAQINACTKHHLANNRTGELTEIWKPPTQTTPHHFFDIGRMFMAVQVLFGISGHYEATPPPEKTDEPAPVES